MRSSFIPQSDVISVTAKTTDSQRSADLANTYVELYVADRVSAQDRYYAVNIDSMNAQIAQLQTAIDTGVARIAELDLQLGALNLQEKTDERDNLINAVEAERNSANSELNGFRISLRDLQADLGDLARSSESREPAAKELSKAGPSGDPIGLPTWIFWLIGGIAGLVIGTIGAFLRERLDRRAQGARQVELALGTRVIGAVPRFGLRYRRGQWALVMANGRRNPSLQRARESYRRLRSSLLYLARADDVRTVVVTSSKPLEGKSVTAANLAISMALNGVSTVLISADLRRPSLERLFGLRNDRGLSSYLNGFSESVHVERPSGIGELTIIPAGPEVANPGELLGSDRFADLIATLNEQYELVIIDTPPLGSAADTLAAAESAQGVLVVVDGKRTETNELLAIRAELDRAGMRILGAILNRDKAQKRSLFARRDKYGYLSGPAPSPIGTQTTGSDEAVGHRRQVVTTDIVDEDPIVSTSVDDTPATPLRRKPERLGR